MPGRLLASGVLLTCLAACAQNAVAQEWTRFRGPNGSGRSAIEIPAQWSESDYRWRIDLPGVGHSSPVVWGSTVFVTSAVEEGAQRLVLAIDSQDGRTLWTWSLATEPHPKHNFNSFASSTPAVDAERIYVAFTEPQHHWLIALDHQGREQWRRDLGAFASQHSGGTSPVVSGDCVVLGNEQDGASSIVAVEAATGAIRWQTPRRADMVSYSTPCEYRHGNAAPQLIFLSSAHGMVGIDPATGSSQWETTVFDKRTCGSPVVAGDLVLGSCGSGGGGTYLVAVRPPERAAEPQQIYRVDKGAPYVPTPVADGERIYLWSDKGIVTCARAADGETIWQERVGGNYFGSPILCGGKLVCVSDSGEAVVLAAGDAFQELGRNALTDENRATPAAADGKLFVRTASKLFCIRGK